MARNVALIVGSLRKDSFTRKLGDALIEVAPSSLSIAHVEIGRLPLYNQDLETAPPAEWVAFRERIRPMDAVLFATPEYNRSIPAPLKNAVDVGSRPYGHSVWSGKPCAIVSCSPGQYGGFGANHHLRQCCVFLDMPCMQQPEAYVAHVDKALGADGKLVDKTREVMQAFMTAFARWIELAGSENKRSAA